MEATHRRNRAIPTPGPCPLLEAPHFAVDGHGDVAAVVGGVEVEVAGHASHHVDAGLCGLRRLDSCLEDDAEVRGLAVLEGAVAVLDDFDAGDGAGDCLHVLERLVVEDVIAREVAHFLLVFIMLVGHDVHHGDVAE